MKKFLAIVFAFVLVLACISAFAEPALGGWTLSESLEVTADLRSLFDRAMENLLGVSYEPLAYLGSQTAAGTNHCFLCAATVIYPGAQATYKLVYVYEDLQGGAQILNIADFDLALFSDAAME